MGAGGGGPGHRDTLPIRIPAPLGSYQLLSVLMVGARAEWFLASGLPSRLFLNSIFISFPSLFSVLFFFLLLPHFFLRGSHEVPGLAGTLKTCLFEA